MYFKPQPKEIIWRCKEYREWIAKWPSHIFGVGRVDCVHIRILGSGGTGIKPHDYFTLPLARSVHDLIHSKGEITALGPHFLTQEECKKAKKKDPDILMALKDTIRVDCLTYKRTWELERKRDGLPPLP